MSHAGHCSLSLYCAIKVFSHVSRSSPCLRRTLSAPDYSRLDFHRLSFFIVKHQLGLYRLDRWALAIMFGPQWGRNVTVFRIGVLCIIFGTSYDVFLNCQQKSPSTHLAFVVLITLVNCNGVHTALQIFSTRSLWIFTSVALGTFLKIRTLLYHRCRGAKIAQEQKSSSVFAPCYVSIDFFAYTQQKLELDPIEAHLLWPGIYWVWQRCRYEAHQSLLTFCGLFS